MAITGARARARAEITAEITATARRHLASHGAAGLSLRAVARDLGMVSSAVYRYVASRDELLTTLIIEAYDALGETAEQAAAATVDEPPLDRFVAVACAVRQWAVEHRHEYALVYGSPVPGYAAPGDTIEPAARVTLALVGVVVDAHRAGVLHPPPGSPVELSPAVLDDLAAIRSAVTPHPSGADPAGTDLADEVVVRLVAAWTQMFGLVSFELFGQTRNVINDHEGLFRATVTTMAAQLGLAR